MNSLEQLTNLDLVQIPLGILIIDLILTAIAAQILKTFYIKFGQSLSNRNRLANNFVPIAVTTALVITIVKSSLALSLGLVGALSIVRFRTAIKEPEELAYLFLSIALGLGFGANQRIITVVAFATILIVLLIQKITSRHKVTAENLYLNINHQNSKNFPVEELLNELKKHTLQIDLKKLEKQTKQFSLSCYIKVKSTQDLEKIINQLQKKYPAVQISIVDAAGLLG